MALDFPVIFLLSTHLSSDELHDLEEKISSLTYDVNEAEVILGKISTKERAMFELRRLKLATEEIVTTEPQDSPSAKRQKISDSTHSVDTDSSIASDGDSPQPRPKSGQDKRHHSSEPHPAPPRAIVKVLRLAWFTESLEKGVVLPTNDYLVYEGRMIVATPEKPRPSRDDILNRAIQDAGGAQATPPARSGHGSWRRSRETRSSSHTKPPALVKQTTSEHDITLGLPPIPDYLHTTYSCQRSTPVHPPNESFIEKLKKIRTTRSLIGDKIGIRAYSTAIATLAAYPYTLSSAPEVARLPGCGSKIAELYQEFNDTGKVKEADEAEADPRLSVLQLFYEIWGVADTTARDFYNKGWRDLDDIVEYGWDTLSRVQQIGVKYYDEFQLKIPRAEVEAISNTILEHANRLCRGYQMVIVGGYRRGKEQSGDVDVILSHPDESATKGFVETLVVSLEKEGYISHTLTLSIKNSERGQAPVSWKGNEKRAGAGFDTLDKALVVWQDPTPAVAGHDGKDDAKKPNPHRRVDIIISPWKTVGCAVLGWTSGTTFQRDLRRYCKKERALKFDSSGIRSRKDGSWVDFESGPLGPAPDMLTAERRVFAGLELEWRAPEERCTG